jgi:prevent-host-death family protein
VDVGVRAFKNGLSGYLRRVRAGQRIVVTGRGRPLAVVTGVEKAGPDRRAANALVGAGIATWGGGKPTGCRDAPMSRRGSGASAVLAGRR